MLGWRGTYIHVQLSTIILIVGFNFIEFQQIFINLNINVLNLNFECTNNIN